MKIALCIALCLFASLFFSQNDTSGQISAIQIEISSTPWVMISSPDQAQFQQFISQDIFLYRDLTGFKKQDGGGFYGNVFEGMAGIKIFFYKKQHSEVFAGLRYGQAVLALTSYVRSESEFGGSFIDPSGKISAQVLKTDYTISYNVVADRFYVPMGITFFTNQRKLFWVSAGVEMCPFLNFSYRFQSSLSYISRLETTNSGNTSTQLAASFDGANYHKNQSMKGISAGGFLGLPIGIHIHPFVKGPRYADQFHVLLTITPLCIFSSSEFGKPTTNFTAIANLGLRYNLR